MWRHYQKYTLWVGWQHKITNTSIIDKSSKPKTKHTDIVYIGDKIYNPVSLNTRAIYNVLTDKKKRAPSCIEK